MSLGQGCKWALPPGVPLTPGMQGEAWGMQLRDHSGLWPVLLPPHQALLNILISTTAGGKALAFGGECVEWRPYSPPRSAPLRMRVQAQCAFVSVTVHWGLVPLSFTVCPCTWC